MGVTTNCVWSEVQYFEKWAHYRKMDSNIMTAMKTEMEVRIKIKIKILQNSRMKQVHLISFVTGTGTMVTDGIFFRISLVSEYESCGCSLIMLCRRYHLIPSRFYVWFRDTRLCLFQIVFRQYHLNVLLVEVLL